MKKKIILVVAVLAILITLICIPKTTYQKWFGKTPNDNPVDTNKEYQTIFVVDEKNKLAEAYANLIAMFDAVKDSSSSS